MGDAFVTILVLGATGFIGSAVVSHAQAAGLAVIATSRAATPGYLKCDVTQLDDLRRCFETLKPNAIVNASGAGVTPGSSAIEVINQVNEVGLRNLLAVLREEQTQASIRLIHLASSRSRSGAHRQDGYIEAKNRATQVFFDSIAGGLAGISLEVFNTYGTNQPGGRLVAQLVSAALEQKVFKLENPALVRDFIHVNDVASAVLLATQSEASPKRSIEIGTGVGTSVAALAEMIYAAAGAPVDLITFDAAKASGPPEVADVVEAQELLNWRPEIELLNGLNEMVTTIRRHKDQSVEGVLRS